MRTVAQRLVGLVLVALFVVGAVMPSVLHDDMREPRPRSYIDRQRNRLTGDLIAYRVREGRVFHSFYLRKEELRHRSIFDDNLTAWPFGH